MIKFKKGLLTAMVAVAATSLSSCLFKKNAKADDESRTNVIFWSCFGSKYTEILKPIVSDISKAKSIEIDHKTQGSYPGILSAVMNAMATGDYPDIAIGYPDHFVQYLGSDILRPLDKYVGESLNDYDPNYIPENEFYDEDGEKHLYGVPFNKSTELLGYNGVFVDYVAEQHGASYATIPETWDEWYSEDPASKVQVYLTEFESLISNKALVYAEVDAQHRASHFEVFDKDHYPATAPAGKTLVLNYKDGDHSKHRLFTWDSTDNAFITLVRQWGAEYTKVPESEYQEAIDDRQGHVLFANSTHKSTTVSMLKFFRNLAERGVFGVPSNVGGTGANFASEAFATGNVMFMVCSSGGLSYNTENKALRFSLEPIPYKTANKKFVISQGANICMTDHGSAERSWEVMKALTTGEFQTRWAMETGYFPASSTAEQSQEYQAFLNSTDTSNYTVSVYRQGSQVNSHVYGKASEGWTRFVDDAFVGSAIVRELVGNIIPNVLANIKTADINTDSKYEDELATILNDTRIARNANIVVEK